ncbi:uncharacterized protein LOC141795270 [Halichoeres trimaculatus]|uniref:uncharacterized protein LOC141795270 n=1 Tax=Halichoeres trimaculatus TaxID=147232 RepID=UPI003D9F2749
MASMTLIRTLLNERLKAAAEEIFQVFEGTIAKYEEEASSSKQEIERLRGLLHEFVPNQNQEPSQLNFCKEETSPQQQHLEQEPSLSMCQNDSEPPHIKEEDTELWADQQQEENQPCLPYSANWETNEDDDDTKLPLQPQTQNNEGKQFQEPQGAKSVHFVPPLPSYQALTLNESITSNQISQSSFSAGLCSTQTSAANNSSCRLCDKSFTSYYDLVSHACATNSNGTDVSCALCGETFESAESLTVHFKSHKGLECHVCGKSCSSVTALTEHMTSHGGLKLHRCPVCGKKCSRKGDLKIHMRIHTGEKPFCCSLCCKSFTHSGHLRKHMRSHTGERPHKCDVCGRGFLQSVHLKTHLGTHHQKM